MNFRVYTPWKPAYSVYAMDATLAVLGLIAAGRVPCTSTLMSSVPGTWAFLSDGTLVMRDDS